MCRTFLSVSPRGPLQLDPQQGLGANQGIEKCDDENRNSRHAMTTSLEILAWSYSNDALIIRRTPNLGPG
jgi:hypothetical protein